MKRIKQFDWTRYIAELTELPSLSSQWEKDMVNKITDEISKDEIKRVLEVGCSNGRWLRWFCREYNCEGYGVDSNAAGFKKKDMNFILGDAFKLPYEDNIFDVVFSLGLIEHFKKHERFLLLKEQTRVLKNNGFLICQVPNLAISLRYFWVKFFYDYRQGFKHFIVTEKELICCFKELNLKSTPVKFLGWFFERFNIPKLFDSRVTASDYILLGMKIYATTKSYMIL
jgi:SAM-dependent methyltransferase